MDLCVKPEIACDEDAVLDRISGTVRLNVICRNEAERRGIADRFVPVLQGWHPDHYLRCLERMPFARDFPLVGIGSMCRRHIEGERGILHVLDVLDRAFSGSPVGFHLLNLKSEGMAAARMHQRVASCDSQAYGVAARQDARKRGCNKPDSLVATTMAAWFERQAATISRPQSWRRRNTWPARIPQQPATEVDAKVAAAMETLRGLHESGEIEWNDLCPLRACEMAFMDEN